MSVWIERVTTSQFEVCLQESRTFDGLHSNIMVVSNVCIKTLYTCMPKMKYSAYQEHKMGPRKISESPTGYERMTSEIPVGLSNH